MDSASAKWGASACAWLLLAACTAPETDCRDGVKQMKQRTETLVGFDQPPDVKRALEHANTAEIQLATGNYEGCVASLGEARTYLRRAQGNNQQ